MNQFVIDIHTHTIASGHAYSSLNEMILKAQELHLELLGVTEHGPLMPGTCDLIYFHNYRVIPRQYNTLKLLLGVEANIYNTNGDIDIPDYVLDMLDYTIASIHGNIFKSDNISQNTNAIINAMKKNQVKVIGHPDDANFPLNYDEVAAAAKEYNVLLEINNSSLKPTSHRVGAYDNYLKLLDKCKKYNTYVSLGSDAHIASDVAEFSYTTKLINDANFPYELIINTSAEKFLNFIKYQEANYGKKH